MTTIIINTREHGSYTFFVRSDSTPDDTGYVFLGTGTDGNQICLRSGSTIKACPETLRKVSRAWLTRMIKGSN
jgi:hypothetical protein